MSSVLAKMYLNRGWRPMEPKDAEAMALVWIETLDRHDVPYRHYETLYQRALDLRIKMRQDGEDDPPDLNAELLATQWKGLQNDIRQREVDAGRTLTSHAQTLCPRCFGTNFEYRFENDQPIGVTGKACQHDDVGETDAIAVPLDAFEAAHAQVRLRVVEQAKAAEETAAQILRRLGSDLFDMADESTDQGEREYLRDLWLKMLRAAKYAREVEAAA